MKFIVSIVIVLLTFSNQNQNIYSVNSASSSTAVSSTSNAVNKSETIAITAGDQHSDGKCISDNYFWRKIGFKYCLLLAQ